MTDHPEPSPDAPVGDTVYRRGSDVPDVPGRTRDRLDRWRSEMLANRFEPVAAALRQAAEAAFRISGGSTATDAGPESDGPGHGREALLAPLADDVLDPVREILDETEICTAVPLTLLETLHELRSRATRLPEAASIQEDSALYAADENDSSFVRIRKALVRTGRRLPGAKDGPPRRTLPLRSIALYHIVERIGSEEIRSVLERRQRIALTLSRVERALSDLSHLVLAAERVSAAELAAAGTEARDRLLEAADALGPLPAAPVIREEWDADVRTSGTFLGENRRLGDDAIRRRLTQLTRYAEEWAEWQQQVAERLAFCVRLIAVRYEMDASCRSVRSNLAEDLAHPAEALNAFARNIREAESDIPADAISRQTLEGSAWLSETESRLVEVLERSIVEDIPGERIAGDIARSIGALRDDSLRIRERFGTTFRLHAFPPPDASAIDPRTDSTVIDLDDMLRQGLEPLTEDQFGANVQAEGNSLIEVLHRVPELTEVIRYNLRAADSRPGNDAEDDDVSPADVVQTGLSRASEAADSMADTIRERADSVDRVIREAVEDAWIRIHERARIQRQMQGAVMDLQREVDVQFRRASETTRNAWNRLSAFARRGGMRGVVLARRLLRRGREAVGAVSSERAGYHETAAALSSLDEMLGQVSPIYRRLFAFTPLTEPELLVGREQDLAFLKKHVALWDVGVPQALVLHGSPSSGRTSILNVLKSDLEETHEIVRIFLPIDLSTEADVLAVLADSGHFDTRDVGSLNELGERILEQPRPDLAQICIVENLGSLMTRKIGGFDLISEFIALMSRTDSRRLWIGTMSESGWKALVSARPEAASLAVSKTLEPIDRSSLERLIMQRHRRSGVPLEFLEPPDPSPLLRRRLRTALGADHRQRVLREAWFDRLFGVTGQDIMMALFYWIRSVDMTDTEDRMLVQWFTPIRFDFLAGFSMDQAFALKAILERGALTVEQHAETNLVSLLESSRILESLGNAMLIEPAGEGVSPTRFDFSSIRNGVSYRIRPLVIHPVIRFLRDRNIVH